MNWEYTRVQVRDEEEAEGQTTDILNKFGKRGWEFTGYATDTGSGTLYLMKREKK